MIRWLCMFLLPLECDYQIFRCLWNWWKLRSCCPSFWLSNKIKYQATHKDVCYPKFRRRKFDVTSINLFANYKHTFASAQLRCPSNRFKAPLWVKYLDYFIRWPLKLGLVHQRKPRNKLLRWFKKGVFMPEFHKKTVSWAQLQLTLRSI